MLYTRSSIVTINIIYYMPRYTHLLNEFLWQTDDYIPDMPRTHKFLNFWKTDIDVIIKDVLISHSQQSDWRNVVWHQRLKDNE